MFSLKHLITVILLSLLQYSAYAQQDSIDLFIKNIMQQRRIPGLQLAVVRDGNIVKTGNYGFANLQDSVEVTDRTMFTINSITKAFTGVAIMQLVEAGQLDLHAPLSAYVTDVPEAWKGVTILQLLSHTSGIPDIVDEEESVLIANTEKASWQKVIESPIDFKPGEEFRYNQTNYLLLGRIIEKLSGVSFQEYIINNQLLKAGLVKTLQAGFGANKDVVAHAADGYTYRKGKLNNIFFSFPTSLQTAAGMSSTAAEMAAWVIALQSGKLLREKSSLVTLWTPGKLNNGQTRGFSNTMNGYAVGWPVISRTTYPVASAVGGGRSAVFVYPENNFSIVVLTNLSGASPESFIDELGGFYFPEMKEANGFGLSPTVNKLRKELDLAGYSHVDEKLRMLIKNNKGFHLEEKDVNKWGYRLMKANRLNDALEIFKLNTKLHPLSANVYDSLGEIYLELGNSKLAIENYKKVLTLDPENISAKQALEKLQSHK